jgi:transcriptional regulator of arginine metabolism
MKSLFLDCVIAVKCAQNIVVIKTYPGMANAAAAAVDAIVGDAIIGSIAGDDTIFIVVRNNEDAAEFTNYIREIIGF